MPRSLNLLDRFEVSDPVCGRISGWSTRVDALDAARAREEHSALKCTNVTVFDVMAQRGAEQKWAADGTLLARRG